MNPEIKSLLDLADAFQAQLPPAPAPLHFERADLAGWIDHTLLKPEASAQQVIELCQQARQYHFASVCVNPAYAGLAAGQLAGSRVMVCSVVAFPLGANLPEAKAFETRLAIGAGAAEIDMVMNIGALKSGDLPLVLRDMQAVVAAAAGRAHVKVILEMCLLDAREKILACLLAKQAGADFVKTSTGFGAGGATVEDVQLMRRLVGAQMGVKAAGGIRSLADAEKMIAAGANRLGASAGISILKEAGVLA